MAEVQNIERLEELAKTMPIFQDMKNKMSDRSGIMWDTPGQQLSQQIQSNPVEFANNEVHRVLDAQSAYAYKDDEQAYIADIVAPYKDVGSLKGEYPAIPARTFYDRPDTAAGKHTPPKWASVKSTLEDYDLSGRALAIFLSNIDRDTAVTQWGSINAWRNIMTLAITRLLTLDREMAVASVYQTSGNFGGGTATASPLWSDAAATLQTNVHTGDDAILSPRDLLVVGHNVYRVLETHAGIKGDTTVGGPSRDQLDPVVRRSSIERFFDSPIVVGSARYNSAPEDPTTPVYSRIWADYVGVVHIGGTGELATPFCRTYRLDSQAFPNVNGWGVKSVMSNISYGGGEILMVGYFAQEKVFADMSGYLLKAL